MKSAYRLSVLMMALAVCGINVYTKPILKMAQAASQRESDSKKNEEITFKLSVENDTIQSGQPIKIATTLENDTSETVSIVESVPEADIRLTITDQAGAPVPLIDKLLGFISVRRIIRKVEAGTTVQTTFAINKRYKLDSEGTYSITASRWIFGMKKGMPKEVHSNTIKIKIVA